MDATLFDGSPPWLHEGLMGTMRLAADEVRATSEDQEVHEPFLTSAAWIRAGLSLLICEGPVGPHDDTHIPFPYTQFLVLRNDQWNACLLGELSEVQPPGAVFALSIHELHELVHDPRLGGGDPLFAALVMNLEEPFEQGEAEEEFVRRWKLLEPVFANGPLDPLTGRPVTGCEPLIAD